MCNENFLSSGKCKEFILVHNFSPGDQLVVKHMRVFFFSSSERDKEKCTCEPFHIYSSLS